MKRSPAVVPLTLLAGSLLLASGCKTTDEPSVDDVSFAGEIPEDVDLSDWYVYGEVGAENPLVVYDAVALEAQLSAPVAGTVVEERMTSGGATATLSNDILTSSGKVIDGWIVGDDGSVVEIRLKGGGTARMSYEQLSPITIYRLRLGKADLEDARAHLELAQAALDAELFNLAGNHFARAEELDAAVAAESAAGLAAVRSAAAASQLALAEKKIRNDQILVADAMLSDLVNTFPDEDAARTAQTLMDQLVPQVAQIHADQIVRAEEASRAKLEPVTKGYARGVDYIQEGLEEKNESASLARFESAVGSLSRAQGKLDALIRANSKDQVFLDAAEELAGNIQSERIRAYLEMASIYTVRTSNSQAARMVNQALALEPDNPQALAMRARIEQNANTGGRRWWWRR